MNTFDTLNCLYKLGCVISAGVLANKALNLQAAGKLFPPVVRLELKRVSNK